MIAHFSQGDEEHENTAQVVGRFGKPTRHSLHFIHCSGVICENCTQHCPCTTEIQQSVCMVSTKMCEGSSQKLMFGGALSLL